MPSLQRHRHWVGVATFCAAVALMAVIAASVAAKEDRQYEDALRERALFKAYMRALDPCL